MSKLNTVLLIVVLFFLLAPDKGLNLPGFTSTVDAAPMAMYFAFAAADESDGGGDAVTCECGGDGDVGDGRVPIECPCVKNGGVCNCPKEDTGEVPVDLGLGELKPDWTYAFVVTNPSWCAPCRVYDSRTLNKVGRYGYKKSRTVDGYPHIVLVNENSPLFNALSPLVPNPDNPGEAGFPSMVIVRNNEIKHVAVGLNNLPVNEVEFHKLFKSIQ